MKNRVICGNHLKILPKIKDGTIDLTITSPPYDNLRDYKGYVFDFEPLAKQLFRVTKEGGVVVWVVADETKNFCESLTSFRQAIYFVEVCGFNLLDTMIYHKSNYAPAYPTMRRYANTFEYMFILSKGRPKTFNPVQRERASKNYKRNSSFRQKDGTLVRKFISHNRTTKDAENVWTICPVKGRGSGNHPGTFPEQLVKDHIISWSNEGDLILDPMAGSGTTLKVVKELGRNYIGIEIAEEYIEIIKENLGELK